MKFLRELLEKTSLFILVLGVVMTLVGAAGGVPIAAFPLHIQRLEAQVAVTVLGILITLVGVVLSWKGDPTPGPDGEVEYDVFLAFPMAAFGDNEQYQRERDHAMEIMGALQTHCGVKSIYCAGSKITRVDAFQLQSVAAEVDLEAIRKSRYFVMIYPEKIVSSVLFEAGFALAEKKDSIYFVKDTDHLPFLMQQAEQLGGAFPRVHIVKVDTHRDIIQILQNNGSLTLPSHERKRKRKTAA